MDNNLISVIIPVYRVEAYLRRCVDSVLAQTYTQTEVILVDDGSPDGCPAICDAYAREDGRVRVIHQENAGLSGARNAGIEAAKGAWLSFVDSDDYLAPEFLERLYRACVDTGSEMSVCRWEYVRGEQPVPERGSGKLEVCSGREMLARLYQPDGAYFVVAWNKLYRRELFQDGYFVTPASITRGFNPKRMDWVYAVAERMDFFEKRGYRELMVPGLQAFADGSIDIYFGLRDHLPDSGRQQEEIRAFVRQGLKRVRRYGRFPLRTAIGYRLFLACPGIYRKLLNRVKSENGKQ